MKLKSLEIRNFRVIQSAQIDFPDKVIAVIGKNGAGKSSLIEAISWALYGNQASRSGKDEIKSTFADESDNCEVKVSFILNDQPFTVIRRLVGKSNRAEVELFRGDSSESVGVNETKSHVGNLLGLDWRGFLSSFLARQSELNALSDLVPSKRKDHIAGMLGIEKLDKAIQNLKQDTKLHKEKALFLERTLTEKSIIEKDIIEFSEKLRTTQKTLTEQTHLFKSIELEKESSKKLFEKISEQRNLYIQHKAELDAQLTTAEMLQEKIREMQDEIDQLEKLSITLVELTKQFETIKEAPKEMEKLSRYRQNLSYANETKSRLSASENELEQLNSQKQELDQEITRKKDELSKIASNISEQLQTELKNLEDKRAEYSSLKAEITHLNKESIYLQLEQTKISTLKSDSICERCRRPLGKDFNEIKDHLQADVNKLQIEISQKSELLNNLKAQGEELKKRTEQLDDASKKQMLLKPELDHLQKEYDQTEAKIKSLSEENKILEEKLNEFGAEKLSDVEISRIQKDFERYEILQTEIKKIEVRLERLPKLKNDLEATIVKKDSIHKLIDELNKKIETLEYSQEKFQLISEKYNKAQNEYEQSKEQVQNFQKEYELLEVSLTGKQAQLKQFVEHEKELESSRSSHFYGEKLSSLLTLFRHDLIASIRPTLADISSRLFNEMTGGKYNLVELDEKYDLKVWDGGESFGVERFSGGEKDLANLCLRLAISLALTESAGMKDSFVILDEVFGSQDYERKENILKALANLKNRFPQIILITHIEDIKDGVEQIIEVKQNDSRISEVVVHGA